MRVQVCPSSAVSPSFREDLRREFPEVLLVLHPFTGRWQAYEASGSSWDAEYVRRAIIGERERQGSDSWFRSVWWADHSAPRIFDARLPATPGDWTIRWLRERELRRFGGAAKFMRDFEERKVQREASARHDRHEENVARSYEARRDVIDLLPTGSSATDGLKELRRRDGRAEIHY